MLFSAQPNKMIISHKPEEQLLIPHFSSAGAKLFLGDVIDTLSKLSKDSVDLVFADPPYNLSNGGFTCYAGKRVSVNKGNWDRSAGIESDYEFHYAWIEACKRVLKSNGSLWISGTYHSIYTCGYALNTQKWHLINDICWYKPNAAPNLSCRMFTASHEMLLWARKHKHSKHKFNYDAVKNGVWNGDFIKQPRKQMRSVWAIGTPKQNEKKYGKHPTQKPIALLDRIITACSDEGDLILDPFCGSGTTGVVAIGKNRRFIGIDAEIEYLESLAIPRIKDEISKKTRVL